MRFCVALLCVVLSFAAYGDIQLITAPNCGPCIRAKQLLNQLRISFREVPATGSQRAPQLIVDGQVITGFDEMTYRSVLSQRRSTPTGQSQLSRQGAVRVTELDLNAIVKLSVGRSRGTAWSAGEGLFVTCAHNFGHGEEVATLTSRQGPTFQARLIAIDNEDDTAVVYADGANLPSLRVYDRPLRIIAEHCVSILGHSWGGPMQRLNTSVSFDPSRQLQGNRFETRLGLESGGSGSPILVEMDGGRPVVLGMQSTSGDRGGPGGGCVNTTAILKILAEARRKLSVSDQPVRLPDQQPKFGSSETRTQWQRIVDRQISDIHDSIKVLSDANNTNANTLGVISEDITSNTQFLESMRQEGEAKIQELEARIEYLESEFSKISGLLVELEKLPGWKSEMTNIVASVTKNQPSLDDVILRASSRAEDAGAGIRMIDGKRTLEIILPPQMLTIIEGDNQFPMRAALGTPMKLEALRGLKANGIRSLENE